MTPTDAETKVKAWRIRTIPATDARSTINRPRVRVRRVPAPARHVRVRRQRRLRSIIPRRASLVRHEEGSFRGGFDATRHVSGDDSRPRAASRVRVPSVRGERRGTVPTVVGVSRRDGRRAARRARASSRRQSTKRRGGVCVARAGGGGGVFRRRKRRRRRKYFFDDGGGDGDGDGHIRRRLARRSRAVPREKAVPSTPLVYVLEARRVPTRDTASIASKAGAGSGASFGRFVAFAVSRRRRKKNGRRPTTTPTPRVGSWCTAGSTRARRCPVSIPARRFARGFARVTTPGLVAFNRGVSNARRASRPAGGALLLANHARVGQGTMASADET